jgi:hypothetical protein
MLQDGKKIPKWKPHARRGLYLGVFPFHSTTVSRVMNLTAGHVSAQYDCVYDDHFSTVSSAKGGAFNADTLSATSWLQLIDTGLASVMLTMTWISMGIPFPFLHLMRNGSQALNAIYLLKCILPTSPIM